MSLVKRQPSEPSPVPDGHAPTGLGALDGVFADRGGLLRLAYRFCWNLADAEDAVQNALLLATRRLEQLNDPARAGAWVKSIVVAQCLELNRKQTRDKRKLESIQQRGDLRETASADQTDSTGLGEDLRRLIAELPPRQRAALVLRHLEGMAYDEIADVMEISASTVRVLVRNGREALREAMLAARPGWSP